MSCALAAEVATALKSAAQARPRIGNVSIPPLSSSAAPSQAKGQVVFRCVAA
jgi:hypothetical protein